MDVVAFARRNWLALSTALVALAGMYFGATRPDTLLLAMSFLALGAIVAHIE